MRAVVGGLAISPFQIPLDCSGLHIIHVLEDELCFWRPSDETRSELLLRSAQVTLVSAAGMRSAKECVGKSYHSYSSFVLNHDRLPRAEPRAILCLQHVLACIPADDWVGNGNMFFLLLGWAAASGSLPGGLLALSERMQHGLRAGVSDAIEVFEAVLTDLLSSTSLSGCAQQTCATGKGRHHARLHDRVVGRVSGSFDCDGLRSSVSSFLRDVKPENLAFLLDVALPFMVASPNTREFRDDGQMYWPRYSCTVNGHFELLSGRLGPKTAVIRLYIPNAKASLWASWCDAQPGFFSGQMLHGRFVVNNKEYDLSGVVIQVARANKWKDLPDKIGHAAVNALTILSQLNPRYQCDDANVLQDIVGSGWNHFSLIDYYKENTKITAEPRFKLLTLDDALLRHVFGCPLAQRSAGDNGPHPKFAKAAAMGLSWLQAHRRVTSKYPEIMLQVSCNDFRELTKLVLGKDCDSVLAAVWSPMRHLGEAFATKFWKFLLQSNSTLLLGLTCILSHWSLGTTLIIFVYFSIHLIHLKCHRFLVEAVMSF